MFLYYIKLAWRNLVRNKFFSLVNIAGLSMGIAACILVYLFIADEKSYDRQNKNADRIYRVITSNVSDDGSQRWLPVSPPAMAIAIMNQLPEAEQAVRLFPPSSAWGARFYVRTGDKKFYEENIYRADSSFFDVFTVPFAMGSPGSALKDANAIVLTESIAKKYFGNENPVGKILEVDDWPPYTVSAVIKDFPFTVHFKIDILISLKSLDQGGRLSNNWGWTSFYTYVKLKPGASRQAFDKKIAGILKEHIPGNKSEASSQPLTSIHLHSNLTGELTPNSDEMYSYVFAIVGLLILLSACINYVNLSTARAASRSKEIGMRKIAGAGMTKLLLQFITEAILSSVLAALLSLLISRLSLPVINTITGRQLNLLQHPYIFPGALLFAIVTGLVAGFYPALHLSLYKPLNALKNEQSATNAPGGLRKLLVIVQFTVSAVLLSGMMIVNQQLTYMQQEKLGLDKEHLIIVNDIGYLDGSTASMIKDEWMKITGVEKVAASDGVPGGYNWNRDVRNKDQHNKQSINFLSIDDDFIQAFNMQIKEGRNFSSKYIADTADKVILNETAIRELNIPSPAIGQQIVWNKNPQTGEINYATICGVVKDFHFTSMKDAIKPFAFVRRNNRRWLYAIKLNGDNITNSIAAIKRAWDKNIHNRPFQFTFLDETYAKLYAAEMNFKKIFTCISVVAIIIACMGLLGLSMFVTRQRTKEISIRKVLGASVQNIILLLSKDFIRLIIIASLIACPLVWWAAAAWLRGYAYHISIGLEAFVLADSIVLLAALLTIGFHAVKAAVTNPANNLRVE